MKSAYYIQVNQMFDRCPELKEEFKDLYEVIQLILHAIDLQEESNEVNKKLNEMNKEDK